MSLVGKKKSTKCLYTMKSYGQVINGLKTLDCESAKKHRNLIKKCELVINSVQDCSFANLDHMTGLCAQDILIKKKPSPSNCLAL